MLWDGSICPLIPPQINEKAGQLNLIPPQKLVAVLKRIREKDRGRDGGIRTHDLVVPNDALYQAEPHPENGCLVTKKPSRTGASDENRTRDLFFTKEVLYL